MYKITAILFIVLFIGHSCSSQVKENKTEVITPAAYRFSEYLPLLKGKKVGLLVNHSSLVNEIHLLDTLLRQEVDIVKIFAPEHGFRGKHDAGEKVDSKVDIKTGIPIVSLYGKNKKPNAEMLKGIDVVIFDIQDVGIRFYTYISSMHYMMEACAESSKKLIILDRPNPNGDYFDGPILKDDCKSFVGMHPIPIVHGLTVAELALMINQEGWLKDSLSCDLELVKMKNWNHSMPYDLPVKPSPNLPNATSIRLYPSLCFFEATNISVGRGTYFPFQVIGYPAKEAGEFTFKPVSIDGMSKHPKQENKLCYGIDLRQEPLAHQFTLEYFISFYNKFCNDEGYGLNERWFQLLSGNKKLLADIKRGLSEEEIKLSWQDELLEYGILREKYLLYPKK
ncbi:exo-beta-N-acetylmuramidase NamZ family protein [Labilibacter marinus]|uniref:exo-beta-N-acetylmuramidase NamZ family protein n=1 Tax=Labilibacter marinus TaxID=1477105 RepID=UPI00082EE2B9|nr:DUF1343 domain-containing protein [Labilibacter marinus]